VIVLVALAVYTLAVSMIYALLAVLVPALAVSLLLLFVVLIVVPTAVVDVVRLWRRRR
jgi:hypothetical protein